MELFRVLMIIALPLVVTVALDQTLPAATETQNQTLPGCNFTCGNVKVPYPFGIGNSSESDQRPCYKGPGFKLTCNKTKLLWGNVPVSNISIEGQMDVSFFVSKLCNNDDDGKANHPRLRSGFFTISSTENKFITVGCNTYGYIHGYYDEATYSTGCLAKCYGNNPEKHIRKSDGKCTGLGCCQVDIPPGVRNITLQVFKFSNSTDSLENCDYSFIAKRDFRHFSTKDTRDIPDRTPLVINWAIGNETCQIAKSRDDYACMANSICEDKDTDYGYRCKCREGYEGNPYHPNGCTDINECTTGKHTCASKDNCINEIGYHKCFCPKGYSGDGTKERGCYRRDVLTKVVIVVGAGTGVLVLFVGISLLYITYQKRKFFKLKEKFFLENGGYILRQQLSTKEYSSIQQNDNFIFTEDTLKKATNNYDDSMIIGKGGYGTVFKGTLADERSIAVKKSKIIDASQIEQFINEMVVLSQINHRNVVKLLGCCLETKVPLLVYEFVSNGTLFNLIHTEGKANNVTWKMRLNIAAEVAGALSYLHSAASIPIIHGDIKSANILLDEKWTAKVSDFGASRLVPLDQTHIATMVQGTIGYLDPEYLLTKQLTEKSDVFSFGVVLVELLSGEKPHSFGGPEERKSLVMHFLSCLKKERLSEVLQVGILNEENKQEIKEVAILASKCLRLVGEERPSMKEVAMELEGIRMMEKHSWIHTDQSQEETQYLLHKASSSIYEPGDSSNHGYTGYDSLRDHSLIDLDDGGR